MALRESVAWFQEHEGMVRVLDAVRAWRDEHGGVPPSRIYVAPVDEYHYVASAPITAPTEFYRRGWFAMALGLDWYSDRDIRPGEFRLAAEKDESAAP